MSNTIDLNRQGLRDFENEINWKMFNELLSNKINEFNLSRVEK